MHWGHERGRKYNSKNKLNIRPYVHTSIHTSTSTYSYQTISRAYEYTSTRAFIERYRKKQATRLVAEPEVLSPGRKVGPVCCRESLQKQTFLKTLNKLRENKTRWKKRELQELRAQKC